MWTSPPRLDRDTMAAVDEARQHDLWVAAHTSTPGEIRPVLEASDVHTIEHGAYRDTLSANLIETMWAQDVVYVPTLSVAESLIDRFDVPDEALQLSQQDVHATCPSGRGRTHRGRPWTSAAAYTASLSY